jgi:CysZ protein
VISRFLEGFKFFFTGLRIVKDVRGVWWMVLIPAIINFLIFLTLMSWSLSQVPMLVAWAVGLIVSDPTSWLYQLVFYPLSALFGIVFIVASSVLVFLIASAVGAPFHGLLAEAVLRLHRPNLNANESVKDSIRRSIRMLGIGLLRMIPFLAIGFFLALLGFLPGINIVATFLTLVLLAFDLSDYGLEAVGMGLRNRVRFLAQHLPEYAGMAAFLGLLLLIPGGVIFLMSFLVAGAADIVGKRSLQQ